jgi:hypothetical protein
MILLVYLQVVFTFSSLFQPILGDWASVNFIDVDNRYEVVSSNWPRPEKPDLPGPRPHTAKSRLTRDFTADECHRYRIDPCPAEQ